MKMKLCSLLEEKRAVSGGLNTVDNKKRGGRRLGGWYLVLGAVSMVLYVLKGKSNIQ